MLKLNNISARYGRIEALKGCSLEIGKGEFVTLIGANGAGKSTMLKAILGLNRPSQGSIEFDGRAITGASTESIIRSGISIVPEGRRIFPEFTVAENLAIGAQIRNAAKGEIEADLERIVEQFPRLKERWSQRAGTMSGGEQQMVAIGRALMSRPRLLLLDEPSLGLAPLVVAELMEKLKEIHRAGTTIFLVEQNVTLALQTAQRGYLMETGRIVGADSSEALLASDTVRKAYLGIDD
ncbi:ABC transporter ATP-binding protein [Achromobacter sp. CSND-B12]|uniref:ABC transporter ATP-binding protein n=1 Tax=Achromobacter sp. CSND-B12 TaxID=3462570 RepID=UPI00406A9C9E